MTADDVATAEWAERLSEALMAPVRDAGMMLAREIDAIAEEIASLNRRVADLEARANGFTGP